MSRSLILVPLLSALLPLSAAAQQGPAVEFEATRGPVTVRSVQPPLPNADDYAVTVAELDADGNGVITRKEVPERHALASEFRLVDRDRDGRITQAELAAWK